MGAYASSPDSLDDDGSVLEALESARIVCFDQRGDKVFVEEGCDNYFCRSITKEQLARLIAELCVIHDRM
jgi:hypothetical protein